MATKSWAEQHGTRYRRYSVDSSRQFGEALLQLMQCWDYAPEEVTNVDTYFEWVKTHPNEKANREAFLDHLRAAITPPRHYPIAFCVLDAWLKGELLPDASVLDACSIMSGTRDVPELETVFDACEDNAGLRHSNVKALKDIADALGLSPRNKNGESLKELLVATPDIPKSSILQMLYGNTRLKSEIAGQLAMLIDDRLADSPHEHKKAHKALAKASVWKEISEAAVGKATEFSTLVKYCTEQSGLSACEFDPSKSGQNTSHWKTGLRVPSVENAASLIKKCLAVPDIADEARLLAPAYDELLHQKSLALWQKAIDDKEPNLLLQACRERYGQGQVAFSRDFCSGPLWHHMEKNSRKNDPRYQWGIPAKEERRAEVAQHTLTAIKRAADYYTEQLGFAPHPWLMNEAGDGTGSHMPLPLTPADAQLARERWEQLQKDFVKNPEHNITKPLGRPVRER